MDQRIIAAAIFREVAIPAVALACLIVFGTPGDESSNAAPTANRQEWSVAGDPISLADKSRVAPNHWNKVSSTSTLMPDAEPPVPYEPNLFAKSALPGAPSSDTAAEPADKTATANAEPDGAKETMGSTESLDECLVVDTCVDQYLWALYRRAPKEDAITEREQRKVELRKKGKLVTITKTWTTVAEEDFSWKDPKAASKAGMSLMDYVIGGVDRDFKLKLFYLLRAAGDAGLSPGITSGFRDDYRQSIASGLKAANNRSYHGGSLHGGYGHGLAADIVSVDGVTQAQRLASSRVLWKWIDSHEKEFGLGRPYLDRDPPHVAPIDGKEYADHRSGTKVKQATPGPKIQVGIASRADHSSAKRARTARSSKVRTI